MSYLLFMDESGHDHKSMPYEVRGGVSIASVNLFKIIQDIQKSEESIFGCRLSDFKTEFKGSKLLEKERFKWAKQDDPMDDDARCKGVRRFLTAHLEKRNPTHSDFTAYGQASLKMADTLFNLLFKYNAKIFAAISPKGMQKPQAYEFDDYLRRDHIRLMERFALFLEENREDGLMIMDQSERNFDKKFKRQLSNYFLKTRTGQKQAQWIVPEPFFIESDINYMVQIADLCIYAINAGFRCEKGLKEPVRTEIQERYEKTLQALQYRKIDTRIIKGAPKQVNIYGIKYTNRPYLIKK